MPSSLDSNVLARRLRELVGEERQVLVDFLLHLDEFDRRRAFLELGYGSLWDYCLKALHLREGAAGRRIGAMRVVRRFPKLEGALRDGRLCLSTVALLGQVLTEANFDELVARAAYRTKAEVDHLVASVHPRRAPKDGIRKVPRQSTNIEAAPPVNGQRVEVQRPEARVERGAVDFASFSLTAASRPNPAVESTTPGCLTPPPFTAQPAPARPDAPEAFEAPRPRTAEVRAVSQDLWSLRATIDGACKKDLETLTMLLSHKLPGGDLAAVLHEAVRCGIEKHGKRKGAVAPARRREREAAPAKSKPIPHSSAAARSTEASARAIPAEVRRQVWERDGGSCSWQGPEGRRCGSRWQLEIDHIVPPSQGGTSTPFNLRVCCRQHNILHAEEIYGRAFMAQFRRELNYSWR